MYLIVITRKRKMGELAGHTVWRAMEFDVIPYKKTILHLTETQVIICSGMPRSSKVKSVQQYWYTVLSGLCLTIKYLYMYLA